MAEKKKQVVTGSNNKSFTNDLFGPKDPPSPASSTLFGSVFGPTSTTRKHDFGSRYGNAKHGISGNNSHRGGKGETNSGSNMRYDRNDNNNYNKYDNQAVEPCNLSSSIYYGGQEDYSPTTQSTSFQSPFKKDGKDEDEDRNGPNSVSRGNWWQGSLYY